MEPVGPAQAPAVPFMISGLQEALAQILTVCTSLAQAVSIQTKPATSQAEGGTQTPAAHTPEQVMQGLQTPGVLLSQSVVAVQAQPPSFSGAESEDAQDFLDRCRQIIHTTGILETSEVSFTTFEFSRAAFRWWEAYERSRPVDATPLSWREFSILFLEKFVPPTHREELHRQFEQLRKDGLSVTQYEVRFSELACHAVWLVPTKRERIRGFIDGLTYQLHFPMTRESISGVQLDEVVDIAQQLEMVRSQDHEERRAKRPRGSSGFGGVLSGGQFYHSRGRPYRPAQVAHPIPRGALSSHGSYSARQSQSSLSALPAQSSSCALSVQGSSTPCSSGSYFGSRGPPQYLPPFSKKGCFECGE
ncbi:uncharacterized protein [Nicotiana tomentosiformis]|uniref:uncharacterized protein n=1 Tax=Nicotiana tomentosiformis TaxID=4098 RepID=UPI00388CA851